MPKPKPTKKSKSTAKSHNNNPHKTFRLTKGRDKLKITKRSPNVWKLTKETIAALKNDWQIFGGITLIYLALLWLINGIPSQTEYAELKESLGDLKNAAGVGTIILSSFSGLLFSPSSDVQQFAATVASIVFLLCFIFLIRQRSAGNKVAVREVLYNAPAPLISFILVLAIVTIEAAIGAVGILVLSYTFGLQDAILNGVEAMLFTLAGILFLVLSVYLLVHSILASVIVTLPNMYPVEALRSAKKLVLGRRFEILIRLTGLFLLTLLLWTVILLPFVLLDLNFNISGIPLIPYISSLLAAVTLPLSIIYLYRLYRHLL